MSTFIETRWAAARPSCEIVVLDPRTRELLRRQEARKRAGALYDPERDAPWRWHGETAMAQYFAAVLGDPPIGRRGLVAAQPLEKFYKERGPHATEPETKRGHHWGDRKELA